MNEWVNEWKKKQERRREGKLWLACKVNLKTEKIKIGNIAKIILKDNALAIAHFKFSGSLIVLYKTDLWLFFVVVNWLIHQFLLKKIKPQQIQRIPNEYKHVCTCKLKKLRMEWVNYQEILTIKNE